jgi:hypothetical protein
MKITLIVGVFFLVLAVIFGVAAWRGYFASQRQWTPAGKTYWRISMIFAIVGLGWILWRALWH